MRPRGHGERLITRFAGERAREASHSKPNNCGNADEHPPHVPETEGPEMVPEQGLNFFAGRHEPKNEKTRGRDLMTAGTCERCTLRIVMSSWYNLGSENTRT